jgi:hypothetical protein
VEKGRGNHAHSGVAISGFAIWTTELKKEPVRSS